MRDDFFILEWLIEIFLKLIKNEGQDTLKNFEF